MSQQIKQGSSDYRKVEVWYNVIIAGHPRRFFAWAHSEVRIELPDGGKKKQRIIFNGRERIVSFVPLARSLTAAPMAEIDRAKRERGLRKTSEADRPARPTGKNREADSFYDDDCVHVKDTSGWAVWIISTFRYPAGSSVRDAFCRAICLIDGNTRNERKKEKERKRKKEWV